MRSLGFLAVLLTVSCVYGQGVWYPLVYDNETNNYFVPDVGVGTPPQLFNLRPNLSSWTTQIPSKDCDSCTNTFDSTYSSSFSPMVFTPSGIRGYDLFQLYTVPEVNISFWQVFSDMEYGAIDGFIGFGYGATVDTPNPPWYIQAAIDYNVEPYFSLFLDIAFPGESKMTLGNVDDSLYDGELTYYPIISKVSSNYWVLDFDGIFVGSEAVALECQKTETCYSVITASTDYILGPSEEINNILSHLGVLTNCSNFSSLENLYFVINGDSYEIPPKIYVKIVNGSCYPKFNTNHVDGTVNWMFGTSFLQSVYSVFNTNTNTIGLARSKSIR